jgi:hypothetical protein
MPRLRIFDIGDADAPRKLKASSTPATSIRIDCNSFPGESGKRPPLRFEKSMMSCSNYGV